MHVTLYLKPSMLSSRSALNLDADIIHAFKIISDHFLKIISPLSYNKADFFQRPPYLNVLSATFCIMQVNLIQLGSLCPAKQLLFSLWRAW